MEIVKPTRVDDLRPIVERVAQLLRIMVSRIDTLRRIIRSPPLREPRVEPSTREYLLISLLRRRVAPNLARVIVVVKTQLSPRSR